MDVLQTLRVPILGICLGSQQLTKSYGMKLSKLQDKFVGTRSFKESSDLAFNHQFGTSVQEFEEHEGFEVLWAQKMLGADGQEQEISMLYEYKDPSGKFMMGVQGHPEKPETDECVREELFARFFSHVSTA